MVNGGFKRKEASKDTEENMAFKYSNNGLLNLTQTRPLRHFILKQQLKYIAHICRLPNSDIRKKMLFTKTRKGKTSIWCKWTRILKMEEEQIRRLMMSKRVFCIP